jgi:hypothetical protein
MSGISVIYPTGLDKMQYQECLQFLLNVMHDNKPNNFYIKHFFIIFQIKKLQRLFDTFVPLGIFLAIIFRFTSLQMS